MPQTARRPAHGPNASWQFTQALGDTSHSSVDSWCSSRIHYPRMNEFSRLLDPELREIQTLQKIIEPAIGSQIVKERRYLGIGHQSGMFPVSSFKQVEGLVASSKAPTDGCLPIPRNVTSLCEIA